MPLVICEGCGKVPKAFDPQNLAPQELRAVKSETPQKPYEGETEPYEGEPEPYKAYEPEPDCNCDCGEDKK